MKVLLIGLRGAGKTTIGRLVAARLGWGFRDLDDLTREELGTPGESIGEIWRSHGEAAFRAAEVRALAAALLARGDEVLPLGGGTPTAPGALELIREGKGKGNVVIYLRAQPAMLRARLSLKHGAMADRPSLTGDDPLEEIETVYRQRDGLYRDLADLTLDTDAESVEETAGRIVI